MKEVHKTPREAWDHFVLENPNSLEGLVSFEKCVTQIREHVKNFQKHVQNIEYNSHVKVFEDLEPFFQTYKESHPNLDDAFVLGRTYQSSNHGKQPLVFVFNKELVKCLQSGSDQYYSLDGVHGAHTPFFSTDNCRQFPFEQVLILRKIFLNCEGTYRNSFPLFFVYCGTKCAGAITCVRECLTFCTKKTFGDGFVLDLQGVYLSLDFEMCLFYR